MPLPTSGSDWAVVAGTVAAVLGITREVGAYLRAKQARAAEDARRDDAISGRPSLQTQIDALVWKVDNEWKTDERVNAERRQAYVDEVGRIWQAIKKLETQDSTRNSRLQAVTGELELRITLIEQAVNAARVSLGDRVDRLEKRWRP